MAHLHNETVDGKNIVFYTDDNGVIWIRAFTLLQAAGIKAPGAALRSYVISHPGVGQKFSYPNDSTGDVSIKYTSAAWHFTYAEALEFLKASRAPGRIKARKAVDSTVKALTAAYLAPTAPPAPVKPAKAAKAKPSPVKHESPYTATIERLTAILTDTTTPHYLQLKALNARTLILELEQEAR
ncbi:hypothetical protein [Rothia mucilaginosa]